MRLLVSWRASKLRLLPQGREGRWLSFSAGAGLGCLILLQCGAEYYAVFLGLLGDGQCAAIEQLGGFGQADPSLRIDSYVSSNR